MSDEKRTTNSNSRFLFLVHFFISKNTRGRRKKPKDPKDPKQRKVKGTSKTAGTEIRSPESHTHSLFLTVSLSILYTPGAFIFPLSLAYLLTYSPDHTTPLFFLLGCQAAARGGRQ